MKTHLAVFALVLLSYSLMHSGCVPVPDEHTQHFDAGQAGCLTGKQLYFLTDGSSSYYERVVSSRTTLPVDPSDHLIIDYSVADPFVLELPVGTAVSYYGRDYQTLYVGSDGTIAMGAASTGNRSLVEHFLSSQLSLLPLVAASDQGPTVRYRILPDSVVVTFDAVYGNTVQCEFFVQGARTDDIVVTYESVSSETLDGIVGLSYGQLVGANPEQISSFVEFFVEADLCTSSQMGNVDSLKLSL